MTARVLFDALAPLLPPATDEAFNRRDICIAATRVAIEVATYFGVECEPAPVQCMLYNAAFAKHVANGFADVVERDKPSTWGDDSWSVGIGYGLPPNPQRPGWNGHLIVIADGCFADYTIGQAERPQHNIITDRALVGPYAGQDMWKCVNETGTVVEYRRMQDESWRRARDWTHEPRRRPIVGKLIRAVRELGVMAVH